MKLIRYFVSRLKKPLTYTFLILFIIMYVLYLFGPSPSILVRHLHSKLNPKQSIMCYRIKKASLPDISEYNPKKGKSIFFHETSCHSYDQGKITINPRQACAVESAALMNPNYEVYLLFTAPGVIKMENSDSDRYLHALLSYPNVKILHLDYENYVKGTPVESLYSGGKVEYSHYAQSHASDVLRYLTLSKYGGIYLDLDVVIIKSLEDLPPNFSGCESNLSVAAGVMSFDHTGIGHHQARQCLLDLKRNFNGNEWGWNGPGVITRLLKKICGVETAEEMQNKTCQNFKVYPPYYFYPIPWREWAKYFDELQTDNIMNLTKHSYAIHVWNKHSIKRQVEVGSKVPYALFAEKYCPKVYSECDTYF